MTDKILNLIDNQKYSEAYELTKVTVGLAKIYTIWIKVYEGDKFDNIDRNINIENFENELIETVKLYIRLSNSNWDQELLSEFRRISKMAIAETSSNLRDITHSTGVNELIMPNHEIRNHIQELIEHFDKKELYESKADLARIKAQLTLTMNLEKQFVGADMIQYGNFYENVNQFEDSIQIYSSIIYDFEEALDGLYKDKNEQLLELDFLKQAYEGTFRLTKTQSIQEKLNTLNSVVLKIESQIEAEEKSPPKIEEQKEVGKSWFKRLFEK